MTEEEGVVDTKPDRQGNDDDAKAADEMIDSNWYKQVPNRAGRLVKRMRSLHGSI